MRGSLRAKIRWLVLLPLFALSAVAFIAFFATSRSQVREQISRDAATTSELLRSLIRERRLYLENETKLLAEVAWIKAAVLGTDKATAQDQVGYYFRFLKTGGNSVATDGLIFVDGKGQVLAEGSHIEGLSFSKGHNDLHSFKLDQALDDVDPKSWSGLVHYKAGPAGKGLLLAATAPLIVSGTSRGAVIVYSKLGHEIASQLAKALSASSVTDPLAVVFVESGEPVASSQELPRVRVSTLEPVHVVVNGRSMVGVFEPLPGGSGDHNTGFVTLRDEEQIFGPARALMVGFLAILTLATLAASVFSGRFGFRMVAPLERIAEAARRLEEGHWPEPLAITSRDEVGVLETSFNAMVVSLREAQEKLLGMVDLDPLTELPNHRRFKQLLEQTVAEASGHGCSLSLAVFDFDNFAEYNRHKGLVAGDIMLQELASTLVEQAPDGASVGRYGPDQFAVILPGHDLAEAIHVGERLKTIFGMSHNDGSGLTLSVGCADLGVGTDRPESLALAAELAVTKAKQLGKNQVCGFDLVAAGETKDPFELHKFLQDGTLATVQALAAAVDAKDSYTLGHSQRVAEYAADLCRHVGGSSEEIELVYRTGTLHDVGKIGVPDGILKKSGPLTLEERAVMETHPALGEAIIKRVPQLADTLPGVRNHHERWDGGGYPDGLVGEDISRLARLLAIADTFDAMTSDRPYRKGLSVDVALSEIEKGAGTQFDPELALHFVAMMRARLRKEAA